MQGAEALGGESLQIMRNGRYHETCTDTNTGIFGAGAKSKSSTPARKESQKKTRENGEQTEKI